MRLLIAVAASVLAASAAAQGEGRQNALDAKAKAPAVEFRSALEGYRPFAEPEVREWRKANDEVKRTPGKPAAVKPDPAHKGHGGHK